PRTSPLSGGCPRSSSFRTTRWRSARGSTSITSPAISANGPRSTECGAPSSTATTCSTPTPPPGSRPPAAATARGPPCSLPRRSAWPGTRRTTSTRRETLPAEMFQAWGKRDPVGLYEEYLKEEGHTERQLSDVEAAVTAQVERAAEEALASRARMPPGESAIVGVYAKRGP